MHRCPCLVLDEADQLLGDVYARDMAHITLHCGKRLGDGGSSDGAGGGGRQTVLVSATLWDGVLSRFAEWCPTPTFVTSGGAPTWADDADEGGPGAEACSYSHPDAANERDGVSLCGAV